MWRTSRGAFPNSLMIGFWARYLGGEIAVDGKEIEQAGWFQPVRGGPGGVRRYFVR